MEGEGRKKVLLSIDGGGVKGVIPICALRALERLEGRPLHEIFSFVAGTSTGAIITAGIAQGIPAGRLLDLYHERARELFCHPPWLHFVDYLRSVLPNVFELGRFWRSGAEFSTATLHRLLVEESNAALGSGHDAAGFKVNDARVDVLITATRAPDGMPWYFVKDTGRNKGTTGGLPLLDCAAASAAAPTYLDSWSIPLPPDWKGSRDPRHGPHALVDGGVGVTGNPVYQACVEAFEYTGVDGTTEPKYLPSETIVVSLGTGRYPGREPPKGLWGWLQWSIRDLLDAPSEQQTELVWRHFPEASFYRIDWKLPTDVDMSDVSEIPRLIELGQRLAEAIPWPEILDGTDRKFLVTAGKTQWHQYTRHAA